MTPNNVMQHPAPGQDKALSLMDSPPALSDGPGKSQGEVLYVFVYSSIYRPNVIIHLILFVFNELQQSKHLHNVIYLVMYTYLYICLSYFSFFL